MALKKQNHVRTCSSIIVVTNEQSFTFLKTNCCTRFIVSLCKLSARLLCEPWLSFVHCELMQRCFRNSTRGGSQPSYLNSRSTRFCFAKLDIPVPSPREPHLKMCNICHQMYNLVLFLSEFCIGVVWDYLQKLSSMSCQS